MKLQPVEIQALAPEVFSVFGQRSALLTVGAGEEVNPMTIGWCQLGRLWSIPVCTVYVRPERYTYSLMEQGKYFTVSVFPEAAGDILRFCGTKSGRDVDKVAACSLTLRRGAGNAPFFDEAEWVLVCRKLYAQDLSEVGVQDGTHILHHYGAQSWHRMYVGEVVEAYAG